MDMHAGRDEPHNTCLAAVSIVRVGVISSLLALFAGQLQAAPGKLAQEPLFLASPVQSNIFFLLDDSRSMDSEVLRRHDGSGNKNLDFTPYRYHRHDPKDLCVGYNVLAYDPTTLTEAKKEPYTPWSGLDADGSAFTDSDPRNARVNPYTGGSSTGACDDNGKVYNTNGTTCDLISGFDSGHGAFYYAWTDKDKDNEYDDGECDTSTPIYVSTMSALEQVNFANWFSYYRKREYILKRVLSGIVAQSTERMGFATINQNNHIVNTNDEVGTQIKNIDDLTVPINASAVANKKKLLDNLLGVDSAGTTPLRKALEHTGQYFMGQLTNDSLFGYTPAADADSASGSSPILNSTLGGVCQQNFAIVMSDGFWNGGNPSVMNADGDKSSTFDRGSYGDLASQTLADVAMHYYETDLMGIDNEVPIVRIDVAPGDVSECRRVSPSNAHLHPNCYDTNTAQHLVTYTVAFGITGTIPEKDSSGAPCVPNSRGETLASQNWPATCDARLAAEWPTPIANGDRTVDDMMHAAWNGRGRFLSAQDPTELINSLRNAVDDIASKKAVSAAAVAVDASSVFSGANVVKGKFDSGNWTGELYSYPLSIAGMDTTPNWAAHSLLDARAYSDRIAVTFNGNRGISFEFPVDYRNTANFGTTEISQAQLDDLMFDAPYSLTTKVRSEIDANQDHGEKLVAYLRGDPTHEGRGGGKLRDRFGHKLGDIVHSAPVYVGDPNPNSYYDASYQVWANSTVTSVPAGAKGRDAMIYVGANDGGLHAFNASASGQNAGKEVFVYFPQAVFSDKAHSGLHYLADPDYQHRYYVDGEIAVGEAYLDLDGNGAKWRTILIGTLRGGGRSIFAMDISEPSEFTSASAVAGKILWEFSDPELGFTYGKPVIAKLNNNRWAAIFGNGYLQGAGGSGEAVLFIKYLDNGSPSYETISTNVGHNQAGDCLNASSNCNGLSTPAVVDLGADNVVDRVYAGDLMGNLWVFDISASNSALWGLAYTAAPLINVKDANGDSQPITSKPSVVLHPSMRMGNTSPNTMVFFGTGQYITENDPRSSAENTFYGIWDSGSAISSPRADALVEQTITQDSLGTETIRIMSNNTVNYNTHRGWFVDLPDGGERVISRPFTAEDVVVYNTIIPESGLCSSSGGSSWLMAHSLIDGSEPEYTALDVNGDGVFDADDQKNGKEITGVKSANLDYPLTPVDVGDGRFVIISSGADTAKYGQTKPFKNQRSSWGRYVKE